MVYRDLNSAPAKKGSSDENLESDATSSDETQNESETTVDDNNLLADLFGDL